MKKPIDIAIVLIFFLLGSLSFAQVDGSNGGDAKGKKKAIKAVPVKELKKPFEIKPKSDAGFKNAFAKKNKKRKEEEDLQNKGILSQAKIAEERFLKAYKRVNIAYPKIDQDLGSFRISTKTVTIICRDFQYPDGDRVTIYVNDIPVVYNITLRRSYQKFVLPMDPGINRIVFKALNQGTSGPNTAGFKVFDDKGNLVSANEWNLATGAKATLLIVKDK